MPEDSVIWRGMTRAELDTAYNNSAAVPDSAARAAEWTARSVRTRETHPAELDLVYGPLPRNRIDLFRCGTANAPLLVVIHGGYWQRNSKDMFSCMAEGPLARSIDVALIGYTLAPEVTLTEIVAETHAAIRWLRTQGPRHGVGSRRLVVTGWSAGGHLTAMTMGLPEVDAGVAVSGIFDVEPCRLNYLNDKLHMTAPEAAAMSPILHIPSRSGPLVVAYGLDELPELQRQSVDYEKAWVAAGRTGRLLPIAGRNHFSILDELVAPDGALTQAIVEAVR